MKKNNQRHAYNALLNIFAFPGLGTLRSGRRLAGAGQVTLVLTGSGLLLLWLYKVLSQYYGMIFSDVKPQSVGWIGITGGIFFCIAWLWAGITSLSLFREASRPEPIPPIMLPMMNNEKIQAGLVAVPKWKCDGQIISRTYEFEDFVAAMKFVNAVAALAEQAQHHPDIDVRWNKVTLGLTTHDAGGLTEKDFALAHECDAQSLR
jgi:4a-hydroxytetrahydrobiopterin dehydratase